MTASKLLRKIAVKFSKLVLVDRGFLDGGRLWSLKHRWGIDFVIPAKTNLIITHDLGGMRDLPEDANLHRQTWETQKGVIKTIGVGGFQTFDDYTRSSTSKS